MVGENPMHDSRFPTYAVADPGFSPKWGANPQKDRVYHTTLQNVPKNCMELEEFEGGNGMPSK